MLRDLWDFLCWWFRNHSSGLIHFFAVLMAAGAFVVMVWAFVLFMTRSVPAELHMTAPFMLNFTTANASI